MLPAERLRGQAMNDLEYHAKLDELDHLLNDPDIESEPSHIWSLLADISHHDLEAATRGELSG